MKGIIARVLRPPKTDARKAMNALFLLVGLIILATVISKGTFFQVSNFKNLLFQNAILGVAALGQMFVIMSGGIDLSIGSSIGVTTVLVVGMQHHGFLPAVLVAVAVAVALGSINGLLVSLRGLPSFVVTLGMMLFIYSLAQVISGGAAIYRAFDGSEVTAFLDTFNQRTAAGIPFPGVVWILMLIVAGLILRTKGGHFIRTIGGNRRAAFMSGVPVKWIGIMVFLLSALFAAVAGILVAARVSEGSPAAGDTYLIDTIAAVAIGGGSLAGGMGTVAGTLFGVVILGILNNILNLIGVSPMLQPAIKGVVILLAVYMNSRGDRE